MDVTFGDAALAALCNSERRLAQKWGAATGRAVGRRLLELAATDFEAIPRLPRTRVRTEDSGETVINFGGGDITVRGSVLDGSPGDDPPGRPLLVIASVDARRSDES
jgi:hypothetical protein